MHIVKATQQYEAWLGRRLTLIPEDLAAKHQLMATAVFPFFRATYYLWAQIWEQVCGSAAGAPRVLGVGDLHVENFGTWRDIEGRLIWGINDLDEAWTMPYTNDLVRLAASALIAIERDERMICEALLRGYQDALAYGGRPYALAEHHPVLREMATARLHEPEKFWEKLHGLPEIEEEVPSGVLKALTVMMPDRSLPCRIVHRIAGLGSLGRQRFVALADWRGGSIAREAKALAPSACFWAEEGKGASRSRYQDLLDSAVRCPDPFVQVKTNWIVRRLAPDCSRIELSSLPSVRDEERLLHAMGWETANIHLGSVKPKVLLADLRERSGNWLEKDAHAMRKAMLAEWQAWKSHTADSVQARQ